MFLSDVRSPFELRGALGIPPRHCRMNRASSPVEAGTSGFLSISDIDLRVSVESEEGSQVSFVLTHENLLASRVVRGVSGLLFMCIWNLWLFLEMQLGFHCPLHVMT